MGLAHPAISTSRRSSPALLVRPGCPYCCWSASRDPCTSCLTQTFQYRVCLAWLTAPCALAPSPTICSAAPPLGCPSPPATVTLWCGTRCCYTGQDRSRPRNAPLDLIGHRIHSCGHGPRQHKATRPHQGCLAAPLAECRLAPDC